VDVGTSSLASVVVTMQNVPTTSPYFGWRQPSQMAANANGSLLFMPMA
jgi:hypothetical protein